ncbi:uncharacterized protein Dana_GF27756 [Drosophila ananassae]|uniref:Uncharacterized protein n=1 Tax=Drosophila ananassae TaxID=7217 RepID=A0A0P8XUB4_DROAN|nr:uncharacterized protein LOC26515165 [Drosophila ananassae]KPU78213.1 uncharacterized protein Dana_GF27756 [Drosophila ananassae]
MITMMLMEKAVIKIEEFVEWDISYFLLAYACIVLMILGVPLAIFLQNKDSPADRQLFHLEANRPVPTSGQQGDVWHVRQDAPIDSIA